MCQLIVLAACQRNDAYFYDFLKPLKSELMLKIHKFVSETLLERIQVVDGMSSFIIKLIFICSSDLRLICRYSQKSSIVGGHGRMG